MDPYYLPGHSQHCYYIVQFPPHAGGNPVASFICQCCPSYQVGRVFLSHDESLLIHVVFTSIAY